MDDEAAIAFLLRLGKALHDQGTPAHRLEEHLRTVSRRLGVEGHHFATPTMLMSSFPPAAYETAPRTHLLRVGGADVDLGRLAALDRVSGEVARGVVTPAAGLQRIEAITSAPPRYGPWITLLAFAVNPAAAARFLGGGLRESAAALILGLAVGGLYLLSRNVEFRAFETTAAFAISLLSALIATFFPLSVPLATISGLIVLLPGYPFTVAINELSTRNLVAGSARITGTALTFLGIAFGVALGAKVGGWLPGHPGSLDPVPLPGWTEPFSLAVAGVSFGVIFRAPARHLPAIAGAAFIAFFGSRWGALALGPELGTFLGAMALGVYANAFARIGDHPSAIPLVPGIMFLVPGAIGYRSLTAMLQNDVIVGIQGAFTMVLVAVALVTGLLVSRDLLPPRRAL